VLTFTAHLLVADAWSLRVFLTDLGLAYRGEIQPDLVLQYVDWAAWQGKRLTREPVGELVRWWRSALSGYPLALSTSGSRGEGVRILRTYRDVLLTIVRDPDTPVSTMKLIRYASHVI
jgi:hypothetical protein